jgi:hypothetical protein
MGKEVPLKLDGEIIGTAIVHENGAIDATIDTTLPLGAKVSKLLNKSLISGLSYDHVHGEALAIIKREGR